MSMSIPAPAAGIRRRRTTRTLAVAAAVIAALAVWLLAEPWLGNDLRSPANGTQASQDISGVNVVIAAAIAGLAGWALLAVLERFTARARTIWTVIAVVVMLASLGGPLSGTGITATNRTWLVLMHAVVGAVLIPLLASTSRRQS